LFDEREKKMREQKACFELHRQLAGWAEVYEGEKGNRRIRHRGVEKGKKKKKEKKDAT